MLTQEVIQMVEGTKKQFAAAFLQQTGLRADQAVMCCGTMQTEKGPVLQVWYEDKAKADLGQSEVEIVATDLALCMDTIALKLGLQPQEGVNPYEQILSELDRRLAGSCNCVDREVRTIQGDHP